ncbi:uncharacterized protein MELLADRAFT_74496 [Melampsora larici-populina 98AG31]|uniref:Secreted protein n=1 Tax=Melampsora larici-populina (strain 98AG31 / pathotype 3-4-7) TaxID=747676 RepID=F4RFY1_MELLP|nr:uncharacterized protein MELLADRAFT_74496 [Melampsora larici-populina 98AG31]EGG08448.1 secreted protein [Melampsora larici-populina 98AG31]
MISLLKLVALSGAFFCMTLGLADAQCSTRGPITIEEQHCLKALPLFPLPSGPDTIIFNGNMIPSRFRTCELKLRTVDGTSTIHISKAAVESAFQTSWNQCHGYSTITITNVQFPDTPVYLDIGAFKDQPGNP